MRIACAAALALVACGPVSEGRDGGTGGGGGFAGGAGGGGGSACGPSNCAGCCNAGHCEAGNTNTLCGKGGNTCLVCNAGLSCAAGSCGSGDPTLTVTLLYDYVPDGGGCDTPAPTEPAHCSVTQSLPKSSFDAKVIPSGCVVTQNQNARTVNCSGGCQFLSPTTCQYGKWGCYWPPDGGVANPTVTDCSWRL